MTAEELFLEKYGNKITASESWVIRFVEDFASESNKELKERLANALDEITENKLQGNEEFRAMSKEISELKSKLEVAEEIIGEAKLQIEYLDKKFTPTGTSASILARIETALSQIKQTK